MHAVELEVEGDLKSNEEESNLLKIVQLPSNERGKQMLSKDFMGESHITRALFTIIKLTTSSILHCITHFSRIIIARSIIKVIWHESCFVAFGLQVFIT